jgi:uncharacterized protein
MSIEKLNADIKTAMKSGQREVAVTLRGILAIGKSLAKNDKDREMTDEDIITAATKSKKEAVEGISIYKDLEGPVAQENYLRNVRLEKLASEYLPTQLSEDEITIKLHTIIQTTGATTMKDMGKVMGIFNKENAKGTFDGGLVSKIVRTRLN